MRNLTDFITEVNNPEYSTIRHTIQDALVDVAKNAADAEEVFSLIEDAITQSLAYLREDGPKSVCKSLEDWAKKHNFE